MKDNDLLLATVYLKWMHNNFTKFTEEEKRRLTCLGAIDFVDASKALRSMSVNDFVDMIAYIKGLLKKYSALNEQRGPVIMKYRKISKPIEVIQFLDTSEQLTKLSEFIDQEYKVSYKHPVPVLTIETSEKEWKGLPGDYVTKDEEGNLSICAQHIFEQQYEVVEAE